MQYFLSDHTTGSEAYFCLTINSYGIINVRRHFGACRTHEGGQAQTSLHKSWFRGTEKLSITLLRQGIDPRVFGFECRHSNRWATFPVDFHSYCIRTPGLATYGNWHYLSIDLKKSVITHSVQFLISFYCWFTPHKSISLYFRTWNRCGKTRLHSKTYNSIVFYIFWICGLKLYLHCVEAFRKGQRK